MNPSYNNLSKRLGKRRLNHALLISPSYSYAYMSNPKAGCSSIKLYLARSEKHDAEFTPQSVHDRRYLPHLTPSQLAPTEHNALFDNSMFIFSFGRHPLARAISAYEDKVRGNRPQKAEILRLLDKDPNRLEEPISFDQFVAAITNLPRKQLNPHWRPQFLNLVPDLLPYHFLGRLENFDEHFDRVKRTLDLPNFQFDKRNQKAVKNQKPAKPSRRNRLALARLYAEDYELFEYRPDGIETIGTFITHSHSHLRKNGRKFRKWIQH